ncbi:MAG: hypothetical protein MUE44_16400 [Oscillatoriaceae cyanobacterium Prado104]|nr:hypothetical protein [Oscillatoriaceae cyanobacterium Prado104]
MTGISLKCDADRIFLGEWDGERVLMASSVREITEITVSDIAIVKFYPKRDRPRSRVGYDANGFDLTRN